MTMTTGAQLEQLEGCSAGFKCMSVLHTVISAVLITGAIDDFLVGECELAMYFLAILNSNDEYKQWGKLNARQDDTLSLDDKEKSLAGSHMNKRRKQYPTDHTQVLSLFHQSSLY